jgi:hypothetical protein
MYHPCEHHEMVEPTDTPCFPTYDCDLAAVVSVNGYWLCPTHASVAKPGSVMYPGEM